MANNGVTLKVVGEGGTQDVVGGVVNNGVTLKVVGGGGNNDVSLIVVGGVGVVRSSVNNCSHVFSHTRWIYYPHSLERFRCSSTYPA